MNVGLLDLCLLGTCTRGVQEVAMALYNTRGFQQAGYIENSPQQTVLILQTISWVSGLCVFYQHLKKELLGLKDDALK